MTLSANEGHATVCRDFSKIPFAAPEPESKFSTMSQRVLLSIACLLFATVANAQEPESRPGKTIIILDASGSMWSQVAGQAKIDIAREVITDLTATLDPEIELGLMAYGHRQKGDCADIELLIPPSKLDRAAFLKEVNELMPKGKTPLSDAVEMASEILKISEDPANIILVSDGLETCDRDPCALAAELAARGIAFKAHVVAFDLSSEDAETIRCLADQTGGVFLQAQDADTLRDALEIAVDEVAMAPTTEPEPEVMPDPGEATIKAPASVPAGSVFEAEWTGPDGTSDYLTIVAKEAPELKYQNYAYTRTGSPLKLTATMDPGPHEVRYVAAKAKKVIGRVDIEVTPVEATVSAAESATAGDQVEVSWTGPSNQGDYITIVPAGSDKGVYMDYEYTKAGTPLKIRALTEPGDAEVRYVDGQDQNTLASIPLKVEPASASVSAADTAIAGSKVAIEWTGPKNQGDYITIVAADAKEGSYKKYVYTKDVDSPTEVISIETPGDAEIRFIQQGGKTLARTPIKLTAPEATLEIPAKGAAGTRLEFSWTGPANQGDYIAIFPVDAPEARYTTYVYAKESPTSLLLPEESGNYEVRYITSQQKNVLTTAKIEVIAE